MAKVYISRVDVPPLRPSWTIMRVGEGPGRIEGEGFWTVADAKRWANKCGHEVVTLRPDKAR